MFSRREAHTQLPVNIASLSIAQEHEKDCTLFAGTHVVLTQVSADGQPVPALTGAGDTSNNLHCWCI